MLDGSILVGDLVRKTVQRHWDDVERIDDESFMYEFDISKAVRVFRFFSMLQHWKGELANTQFTLSGWQAFIIIVLFGWVHKRTGYRRFLQAYIQLARKNGKTTFAAAIGLYLLCADGESGAEIYTFGVKRDQARISHRDALEMRKRSPKLMQRVRAFKDNLSIESSSSKFEPLGANSDSLDGLNVHGAIGDELHRHKDRDLWDVIEYGTGARTQPLMLGITTAGSSLESFCYELREHSERILQRAVDDERFFCFVAEPDKDDDLNQVDSWIKGNPNLGISVQIDKMQADFDKSAMIPSALANFRRYRLNKWIAGGKDQYFDIDAWNECPNLDVDLTGRECFGGLDLASTQDVAAFVLYFPPTEDDHMHHAMCFFWIPAENVLKRARNYLVPLESWIDQGYVMATEGNVIDYAFIRHTIVELKSRYAINQIGFDDWNSTQIVTELMDHSISMIPLNQTAKTFNTPLKRLADISVQGTLNYFGNPVLKWMASNTYAGTDTSGREKPLKSQGKKNHKIDGIVALLMGMQRAIVDEDDAPEPSIYEKRGMMSL